MFTMDRFFSMKYILLLIFCFFLITGLDAQTIKTFKKFDTFNKEVILENDTTYVINFWATWCKPCVRELPYFEALHKENKDPKLKIVLVSLDFEKQITSIVLPFLKTNQYTAQTYVLLDKSFNDWLSLVDPEWSGSIPATLIVSGKKRKFAEQEFESFDELKELVNHFQQHK